MTEGKHIIEITNRKAAHLYFFEDEFEAGIQLTGTEIKSIRKGQANLKESYCVFYKAELYVRNMHISEYKYGTIHNHEPKRERKLLLRKSELKKIERRVKEKGFTVIPYKLYINERGLAKLQIMTASGKKSHDKRHSIKDKDIKRDMDRRRNEY